MRLAGLELLADLHQKHGVMLPADGSLPLIGGQVGEPVLQLLGGDEVNLTVRDKGQNGKSVAQGSGCVADSAHDVPHRVLQILHVAVGGVDVLFPVPLIDVDGVKVVHLLIPADGIHIGVEAGAGLELIALESETLPLGQRVHHLTFGAHVGDVEGDGTLYTVEVIIQAGLAVYEEGSGDPMQIEPYGEAVLKLAVDQFNGPLQLVVGQGHPVSRRDHNFTHSQTVLFRLGFYKNQAATAGVT